MKWENVTESSLGELNSTSQAHKCNCTESNISQLSNASWECSPSKQQCIIHE
jgi:uncharacterized cupin superfamily protein